MLKAKVLDFICQKVLEIKCHFLLESTCRLQTCSFMIFDEGKTYDLAYCVHKNYWSNGFATEIAQGMIE
ncbi:MAG TPA: hypothetical protein VJY54_03940, partial [Lachnospiraceae bacterium]|nr:hypothetical protein [Lachnospiraceae bacterium]